MSTISSAAESARENSRRSDGRFGEQPKHDPGQLEGLGGGQRPEHLARLDRVLARYGLAATDLPGIEEAWSQRFAVVDDPTIPSTGEYLDGLLGHPDYGRHKWGPTLTVIDKPLRTSWDDRDDEVDYQPGMHIDPTSRQLVIAVGTRNWGGSEDHPHPDEDTSTCPACKGDKLADHPLYVGAWHESYDGGSVYYFQMPEDRLEEYEGIHIGRPARNQQQQAARELEKIETGHVSPWSVLATPTQQQELAQSRDEAQRSLLAPHNLLRERQRAEALTVGLGLLESGHTPEGCELDLRVWLKDTSPETLREVGAELRRLSPKVAQFDRIRELLPTLPEEVRDYLVGERPEETRLVRAEHGRRFVPEKYRPESPFVVDERKVRKHFALAEKRYEDERVGLVGELAGVEAELRAHDEGVRRLVEVEGRAWAAGWPGDAGNMPPMPHVDGG